MTLRDSQASHFPLHRSPPFSLCPGWRYLSSGQDHNTQHWISLWQSINRNRYPYFPLPTLHSYAFLQPLSLHRWICKSCYLLLLETTSVVSVFRLSFTLPPPSPFPMSSFSLIPSFLLSLHRGIKLSAQVYKHRYPLCSTFLSALLSLPSFNNLPSSITHFHLSPPLTAFQRRQEYLSAIGQRVQPFG